MEGRRGSRGELFEGERAGEGFVGRKESGGVVLEMWCWWMRSVCGCAFLSLAFQALLGSLWALSHERCKSEYLKLSLPKFRV